uniref:Uncharacterized protein n=1 Tax=Rousettus aegyptiacus TaxID=9407 RepID=A0A7J8D6N2_ROUAE|nr:hypothetical protein HJG63_008785 [Rousettus aegyptiacus]
MLLSPFYPLFRRQLKCTIDSFETFRWPGCEGRHRSTRCPRRSSQPPREVGISFHSSGERHRGTSCTFLQSVGGKQGSLGPNLVLSLDIGFFLSTACLAHRHTKYIVLNLIDCEMQNTIQNKISLITESQIYVKNKLKYFKVYFIGLISFVKSRSFKKN